MAGSKVPALLAGHLDRHRPGLGQHRLAPGAVTAVAVAGSATFVGFVAQVVGDLALQSRLQHQLRQLAQQPVLPGQVQALLPGPGDQLRHQGPIHRRDLPEPLLDVLHLLPSHGHGLLDLHVLRRHHIIHRSYLPVRELHRKTYSPGPDIGAFHQPALGVLDRGRHALDQALG